MFFPKAHSSYENDSPGSGCVRSHSLWCLRAVSLRSPSLVSQSDPISGYGKPGRSTEGLGQLKGSR